MFSGPDLSELSFSQHDSSKTILSQPNLIQAEGLMDIELPSSQPCNDEVNQSILSPKVLAEMDSTASGVKYCWRQVLDVEKVRNGHHVLVQWQSKNDNGEFQESWQTMSSWTENNAQLEALAKWVSRSKPEKLETLVRTTKTWKQIEGKMVQMGLPMPTNKQTTKGTDRFGRKKKKPITRRQL